jgi:hypothetical protein
MSEKDRIEVAVIDQSVYLKPYGFATQDNSLGIPDFLSAMFRSGCLVVLFDLSECKGMDSTFLGVMADAACGRPRRRAKTAVVVNADEDALRQLRRVGLLGLVKVRKERIEQPEGLKMRSIDFLHFPKTEMQRLETIRQLHEKLASLNEKNRTTFGSFLTMIEEELQQHRSQGEERE